MRITSGSCFVPSKDGKKHKSEGDVHVVLDNFLTIGHGTSEFVSDLVFNSVRAVEKTKGFINPKELLNEAYLETKVSGACTACILTLNQRCLHVVNVGNNGFILIRNGDILYESPVQEHTYKIPYQLGSTTNDPPEEIKLTEVEPGDIIVAGSAGLFNNLFSHEIRDIVMKEIGKNSSPQMIAAEIAKLASERSTNKYRRFTPYANAAWQAGKRHKGGKIGDVTAIFSFILPK